jgi:hypothetical protein
MTTSINNDSLNVSEQLEKLQKIRESQRKANKKYRESHPEKFRDYSKKYYETNKDKQKETMRLYYLKTKTEKLSNSKNTENI